MPAQIIINRNNYVANSGNQYSYRFANNPSFKEGDQISVVSLSMFNSIRNIEAKRNNNSFQIIFNFATPVTMTVTLPDSFYTIEDINTYIQSLCYTNNYYVTDSSSQIVYFFEMLTNINRYTIQVNTIAIPTSAQATTAGYTKPSGATWNYPATAQTTQLVVLSNNFKSIIGFASGTFPTTPQTTVQSFESTICPILQPVSSFILRCNLICSPYNSPYDILHTQPITVTYGSSIQTISPQLVYNNINIGTYNELIVSFHDQSMNPLTLIDTDVVITLAIKLGTEK